MAKNSTNGNGRSTALSVYQGMDPITINQLIANLNGITTQRTDFFRQIFDPRRSIEEECGWPKVGQITLDNYQELYDRHPIPRRVVECLPLECWQESPEVYEDEDADTETEFEVAWQELGASLKVEESYYAEDKGSAIWELLLRADILSRIGRYGVILLGFDDGKKLSEPFVPRAGSKLLYANAFPEYFARVNQFDSEKKSKRNGRPNSYTITFNDPREPYTGMGLKTTSEMVHWTRVIHVVDNRQSSVNFGTPAMQPVYNNLLDLMKLYGGSAEGYWKGGAMPITSFETNPQLGGDVDIDREGMRDMAERVFNGMQKYWALSGMSAKTLAPTVADPTPQINAQIEAICIILEYPMRVFKGSERGELSSGQDAILFDKRKQRRKNFHQTPNLVCALVDRLIWAKVLPEPEQYYCKWPQADFQTATEKADILTKRTTALSTFVSGGVEQLIPPMDYLTREAGYEKDEAESILDQAMQNYEQDDTHTIESQTEVEQQQQVEQDRFDAQMKAKQLAPGRKAPLTNEEIDNMFCATGPGGGIDPSCGKGGKGSAGQVDAPPAPGKKFKTNIEGRVRKALQGDPVRLKEFNGLLKERNAINKQVKGGAAGDATKWRQQDIKNRIQVIKKDALEGAKRREHMEGVDRQLAGLPPKAPAPRPKDPHEERINKHWEERQKRIQEAKRQAQERLAHETNLNPAPTTDETGRQMQTTSTSDKRKLGGGINGSYKVTLASGETAVWKPRDEENKGVGGRDVRAGVKVGESYKREAAAYSVAKEIGLTDMVPVTVERRINGKIGAIQQFQKDHTAAMDYRGNSMYDGPGDLARAAAFDFLIANTDRHDGNWMLSRTEKIKLIDHGLAFPTNGTAELYSFLYDRARGRHGPSPMSIPAEVKTWDPARIERAMRNHGLEEEAIQGALSRLRKLQRVERFDQLKAA